MNVCEDGIFIVNTYKSNGNSICKSESFHFSSLELALKYAIFKSYEVKIVVENPHTECTIEHTYLIE